MIYTNIFSAQLDFKKRTYNTTYVQMIEIESRAKYYISTLYLLKNLINLKLLFSAI